jgi:hypothetical protein
MVTRGSSPERQELSIVADPLASQDMPSTCPGREVPAVLHGQSWRAEAAAQGLCPTRVKLFPSSRLTAGASGRPRLRDGPGLDPKVVGHQLGGYPATSEAKA